MASFSLLLFCISLLLCLFLHLPLLAALLFGLLLFIGYGIYFGRSIVDLLGGIWQSIQTIKNILITFVLIGMLTAVWRASGTLPLLVCCSVRLLHPSLFLLSTFLLNCLISLLTGTSFGTAATMGVICSMIGTSLGVPPALTGGTILSGIFFGDRCSPISTSAILVSTLTQTDLYANIRAMFQTAAIPFAVTCLIYGTGGILLDRQGDIPDLSAVFQAEFTLSPYALLPAILLLLLSICKVDVKLSMALSIVSALCCCLFLEHIPLCEIPALLWTGFSADMAEIAPMLNGGGIISMLNVIGIVCISSAYAGIFPMTDLLDRIQNWVNVLAHRTTPVLAVLVTALLTGILSCNQTLCIILTHQLTKGLIADKYRYAVLMENSAVVIPPLIPWSIASMVPLNAVDAPSIAGLFAVYLYLLPLFELVRSYQPKCHDVMQ